MNQSFWTLLQHEQEFHFLLPHCVFLLILWGGNFGKGQSGPSLPVLWPWVPDRYKSVCAGQHSSEQVNRASSNPLGGPQSAGDQQRLLQMLTFADLNSLAFWKTKFPVSKTVLQMVGLPSFQAATSRVLKMHVVSWRVSQLISSATSCQTDHYLLPCQYTDQPDYIHVKFEDGHSTQLLRATIHYKTFS